MTPPVARHATEYAVPIEPQRDDAPILALSCAVLDALVEGIAFFDRAGRTIAANAAMRAAMTSPALQRAVREFRESLVARSVLRQHIDEREVATRELVTCTRTYQLRGIVLSQDHRLSAPRYCITLQECEHTRPSEGDVRRRFGFTAREARVALCIAEGMSNKEIAASLCVSPHTARHHTEHVFAKMAVESRGALAWELLRV
jgi:DNA-binding CsgD family transcriptional regulator